MFYKNTKIVLKSRPEGFPSIDNFSITEEEIREIQTRFGDEIFAAHK